MSFQDTDRQLRSEWIYTTHAAASDSDMPAAYSQRPKYGHIQLVQVNWHDQHKPFTCAMDLSFKTYLARPEFALQQSDCMSIGRSQQTFVAVACSKSHATKIEVGLTFKRLLSNGMKVL